MALIELTIDIPYWVGSVITIGLLFDVIGAGFLAFPDIPMLWKYTHGGKVISLRDRVMTGTDMANPEAVSNISEDRPDHVYTPGATPSFPLFVNLIRQWYERRLSSASYSSVDINPDDLEELEFIRTIQRGEGRPDVVKGVTFLHPDPADLPNSDFEENLNDILQNAIQPKINEQDRRCRRAGIAILVFGFLNQIIANVIPILVKSGHWELFTQYYSELTSAFRQLIPVMVV